MTPAISHISAARFWLSCAQESIPCHALESSTGARNYPLIARCIDAARSSFSVAQDEPAHFLTHEQRNRRVLSGAISHSVNDELPAQSILGYSKEASVGIVSPEISFMQMSCLLSRVDAIRYRSGLCGRFAMSANDGTLLVRKPLTSVNDIQKHIDASPRMNGRKQAAAILPYIIENARSPREIDVALSLSLPIRKGGFGLPRPAINENIRLHKPLKAQNRYGEVHYIGSLECDMVWRIAGKTIVLEYQGEQYHGRRFDVHRDSLKRNALIEQGVHVLTISNEQFCDFEQFQRFTTLLKETLGVKPRSRVADPERRQRSLHAQVIKPFAL